MNDVCLEQANHCLGECIVIRTTVGADAGFQPCIGRPFCAFDRQILATAFTLVDQIIWRLSVVVCLFQSFQYKLRLLRLGCPLANDLFGKDLDRYGDVDIGLPSRFQTSRCLFGHFDRFCPIRALIHNQRANLTRFLVDRSETGWLRGWPRSDFARKLHFLDVMS